jgi:hypothetical protein
MHLEVEEVNVHLYAVMVIGAKEQLFLMKSIIVFILLSKPSKLPRR